MINNKKNRAKNEEAEKNTKIRLNKYLADCGVASRRKADELIERGAVRVNGAIIIDLGTKIDLADNVTVFGDPVKTNKRLIYILLNKPKDYIATTKDDQERKTVMDLVKTQQRIFPVGRLDRNTTGVLLLTNDGDLTYRLTHPKYQIEKIYILHLDKELKSKDAKEIANGIEFEGISYSACELFIDPKDRSKITLSLTEGKNHEVKKMFEALGYNVRKLDRKFFAGLSNSGMKRGEYRNLSLQEIQSLMKLTGLQK